MKKICILIILFIFLMVTVKAYSITFEIQPLTTGYFNTDPSNFNGNIAWRADEGIYYWDGSSTKLISQTETVDLPSLYDGTIAFYVPDNGINYWDGFAITSVSPYGRYPSLYDGTIAYQLHGGGIYYWDGINNIQISASGYNPTLYNGQIAWYDFDGNDDEIFFWDGTSVTQITDNEIDDWKPSLYDGSIAWQAGLLHDDIYYWNGIETTRITYTNTSCDSPSLYDGKIAWSDTVKNSNNNNNEEIFYWDGSHIYQVTNDSNNEDGDFWPSLYTDTIAWTKRGGHSLDFVHTDKNIYYAKISSDVDYQPVPEPATSLLFLCCIVGIIGLKKKFS